jgi:hypothetical protein
MVDCIEHNVSKAIDYVEDAADNVNTAEQDRKSAVKVKNFISII